MELEKLTSPELVVRLSNILEVIASVSAALISAQLSNNPELINACKKLIERANQEKAEIESEIRKRGMSAAYNIGSTDLPASQDATSPFAFPVRQRLQATA